jgi:hypothetical protein
MIGKQVSFKLRIRRCRISSSQDGSYYDDDDEVCVCVWFRGGGEIIVTVIRRSANPQRNLSKPQPRKS